MVKNIILDIGGVLADFRWSGLMRDLGFSQATIDDLNKGVMSSPLWNEFDREAIEPIKVIEEFKKNNPKYVREIDLFFENIKDIVVQFDYTEPFIKELKDKGYQVYLLSNYPSFVFELHIKDKYNFLPYIDGKIVSGYVKMIKPEPEIYQLLLQTYHLKAEECVFLDDKQENIEAALEMGMKGIVFHSYEQAREELKQWITL